MACSVPFTSSTMHATAARRGKTGVHKSVACRCLLALAAAVGVLGTAGCGGGADEAAEGLHVVATTPDGGDLAQQIGGERVSVVVLSKGSSDPHRVEPRQSMVVDLAKADLLVTIGQGLEKHWLNGLVTRSGNPDILGGKAGRLSLDGNIALIDEGHHADHGESYDEQAMAMSLHPEGDPHFLLDPLNGVKAAEAIRDQMIALDPEGKATYEANFDTFKASIDTLLNGTEGKPGLIARFEAIPANKKTFVGDHDLWTYFGERFGLEAKGYMEKVPGVEPSVPHLQALVQTMQADGVGLVLAAPYFDRRHAKFLADQTGATVVTMAHQTQGVPEAKTYLEACRYNAEAVLKVLEQQ